MGTQDIFRHKLSSAAKTKKKESKNYLSLYMVQTINIDIDSL